MIDYQEQLTAVKKNIEQLQEACLKVYEAVFTPDVKKALEAAHSKISLTLEQAKLNIWVVPAYIVEALSYAKSKLPKNLKLVETPLLERPTRSIINIPNFLYPDKSFVDIVVDKLIEKWCEKIDTLTIVIVQEDIDA